MKILKTACCVLLATAALCGCGKDEGSRGGDGQRVEALFSAGIDSRASDASWHPGDNIGITMLKNLPAQGEILDGKHNHKYTCANGVGNFRAVEGQTIYYPLDGTKVDFVGYYPYTGTENLIDYHKVPVDVSSQDYLPNIDLMTFDRYCGASKNNASVSVEFRHRLTKLVFNFTKEDQTTSKRIAKLEILGMKTTGRYDMLNSALEVDAGSQAVIEVPVAESPDLQTGSAAALVLPREAASGVTFRVTLENEFESQTYYTVYEVGMSNAQKLEEGTAYKFNILLRDKETPVEISASIVEWNDGGTENIDSKPLTIMQIAGSSSELFTDLDKITLYLGQTELATYTYTKADDTWTPNNNPLYWEYVGDGYSTTVSLRASYVRAAALNSTQMPEVALASVPDAVRFEPLELDFFLQPAKVVFEIVSENSDPTRIFSADDLESATIVLPDYVTGYTLEKGVFTIDDQTVDDVTVAGRVALIVPQKKTGLVAWITLNNNRYRVESFSELDFQPGKVTTIRVNMTKTGVTMSATYNDWTDDGQTAQLSPVVVGGGQTNHFVAGDKFTLYYGAGSPAAKAKIEEYTYEGAHVWRPATAVYWEGIEDRTVYDFYAVCKLNDAPSGSNQMADWMYAEHVGVTKFGLLNLPFDKKTARIVVKLTSSDSGDGYTALELVKAKVTLPDYWIGGGYNGVEFVPGVATGDVKGTQSPAQAEWVALVEPQKVKQGSVFIRIDMGNGNIYDVKAPEVYAFVEGTTNTFTVTVKKIGIDITASYSTWTGGHETDLETDLDQ